MAFKGQGLEYDAKRKRIEDEESEDMDDSPTASESGEESGSGSEEVSDDEEQVVEKELFSPILKSGSP